MPDSLPKRIAEPIGPYRTNFTDSDGWTVVDSNCQWVAGFSGEVFLKGDEYRATVFVRYMNAIDELCRMQEGR